MSANSDVERELAKLKGELTASAPKQLEGAPNGEAHGTQASQASQDSQSSPGPYAPQYTPPPAPPLSAPPPQQNQQTEQVQQSQQAQPAGLPVSDLPGLADEPQDGDGS